MKSAIDWRRHPSSDNIERSLGGAGESVFWRQSKRFGYDRGDEDLRIVIEGLIE
jgi:hypothetical protein